MSARKNCEAFFAVLGCLAVVGRHDGNYGNYVYIIHLFVPP